MSFYPSVRSAATTGTAASNNHTIDYPATIEAGDTLLCIVNYNGTSTMGWPDGWTEIYNQDYINSTNVAWKKADGTEDGGTFTLTTTQIKELSAIVYAIKDATDPTVTPPEASAESQGTTDNPNPPSLSPSGGSKDYMWVAIAGNRYRAVTDYPADYDSDQYDIGSGGTTGGSRIAACTRTTTADTENPGEYTIAASDYCNACTVAVYGGTPPAPSGAPSGWVMLVHYST